MSRFSIFECTSSEYADLLYSHFGKGRSLAMRIYSSWYKSGKQPSLESFLIQERALVASILEATDFSLSSTFYSHGLKRIQRFEDGLESESVEIPMESGKTLCLSSQIGCRMGCSFCETGRLGLLRSMTVKEIVWQCFYSRFIEGSSIKNLVFMGMGEPLDAFEQVKKAVQIFTDPVGFGFGPSRICISTSGLVDQIDRWIIELDPRVKLALSLHAANDALRSKLMPINRSFSLKELKEALLRYEASHPKREILIEYLLLDGVNDTEEHAEELLNYLDGLSKIRVNLIPYNPQSRPRYRRPSLEQISKFADYLRRKRKLVLIRGTKGEEEMAACGQLGNLALRGKIVV